MNYSIQSVRFNYDTCSEVRGTAIVGGLPVLFEQSIINDRATWSAWIKDDYSRTRVFGYERRDQALKRARYEYYYWYKKT